MRSARAVNGAVRWAAIGVLLFSCRGPAVRSDEPAAASPMPAAAKHANRLARETSPYLLLHAHNPVDWYPWGAEALARAQREKKLIFLSVGYSSCYWCHVMERQSFMDDEIARVLNEHFVCIKVDREERPDIDEIYMQALHIYLQLAGSKQGGGWPLSMFLTPDAKPLMGGTYFPPRDTENMLGFATVLDRVLEAWRADPEKWQKTGDSLAEYVAESLRQQPLLRGIKLDRSAVDSVLRAIAVRFDTRYGGFSFDEANPQRAKFPEPPNLMFLVDYARRHQSEAARKMLLLTLDKISQGGIRDHVGGGFHRYSTDRFWRVPHFEKMLYDNGQLVTAYARACELEPRDDYRCAVDETVAFVLRELTDPGGAFYAALDAETDAEEGRYYVWTREEVQSVLSGDDYALFADVYGIGGDSNFEERYIPLLAQPLAQTAQARGLSEAQLDEQLKPLREKLFAKRSERQRPLTDTKILAGWNGLMIRGLAESGRVFQNQAHLDAAEKAAGFVLAKLRDPAGHLLRAYADGQSKIPAFLDDYAFLADGLIALHQATGQQRWLDAAAQLTDEQLALFWDERAGGLFYTSTLHEQLIARSKLPTDTVTPSGNSVTAANLLYLAEALARPDYSERAEACLRSAGPVLDEHPQTLAQLAVALSVWIERTAANPKSDASRPGAGGAPAPQK